MPRPILQAICLLICLAYSQLSWTAEPYWIDVRTAGEYEAAHVPQAVNIPYEEISDRISEVSDNRDALIYVYCRSGRRSGIAKEALEALGYTRVIDLETLEAAREKAAALNQN
jgi:phage shock protein E